MIEYIKNAIRSLSQDTRGGTTVEFMMVMPLVVFWFAGSFTFFNAYSEYNRALKATYTVGDILSRQTEVDDDYIDDMNRIFANFMDQSTNDTWIRITSVQKTGEDYVIDWSTATGLHNALTEDDDIPVEYIPDLVDQESVILVQSYTPFIPFWESAGLEATTYDNTMVVSPRFTSKLANTDS